MNNLLIDILNTKESVKRQAVNAVLKIYAKTWWDQALIDNVADEKLIEITDCFDSILKPIKAFIKKKNDYESAIDSIIDIYKKSDTDPLEEFLIRTLFAAETVGRVSVNLENKNSDSSNASARLVAQFFNKEPSQDDIINALTLSFNKEPEDAVKFLESKGIEISWDWQEQLDLIKQHAFTVAKVSKADVVQMFKDELESSLKEGTTYQDFQKNVGGLLQDKGYATREDGSAWRLDTIFRTNMQTSYMAGRYKQMQEVAEDFPYWEYIATMDSRTRPEHAALNGKVLKANDPFWATAYPPNGYACRCRIMSRTQAYVDANKIKISKGSNLNYEPDEGFATNPGEQWQPDLTKYETDLKKLIKNDLATIEK